jgi:flagellar motor protein MotB
MTPHMITRQETSYRQGLVLGLTMAELMVLLVFCLLVAVGVALATERAERNAVERHLKSVEQTAAADAVIVDSIRRNPKLAELVDQTPPAAADKIDEFWRKLVVADEIVDGMTRRGVSSTALRDASDDLAKMVHLRESGLDPDAAARGAALAAAIDKVLPADASGARKPEAIAALIEKGMAAGSTPREQGDHRDGHDWPPIINLSEAGGYFFSTGSAEVRPDYEAKLRSSVVDRLLDIAASFSVDVIEVIGHTDERPLNDAGSNLDRQLPLVVSGASGIGLLHPADNAGLGLARALAVVRVLSQDPRLKSFRILPLSAAQLVGTDGRLTNWNDHGDVQELRRIEIRMRKSS